MRMGKEEKSKSHLSKKEKTKRSEAMKKTAKDTRNTHNEWRKRFVNRQRGRPAPNVTPEEGW